LDSKLPVVDFLKRVVTEFFNRCF